MNPCYNSSMDETSHTRGQVRLFTSFVAAKDEEYAYWQLRPVYERLAAASELSGERSLHRLIHRPGQRILFLWPVEGDFQYRTGPLDDHLSRGTFPFSRPPWFRRDPIGGRRARQHRRGRCVARRQDGRWGSPV
jgi:hypothetical protein